MDQNKIVEALQKALAHGTGSLDDLDNLLKRAQSDIAQAKKNEAEAKEKAKTDRGNKVAQLATRLLNSELTDDDMAFVMNTFYAQHGLQAIWDGPGIAMLMTKSDEAAADLDEKAEKAIDDLCNFLNSLLGVNLDRNQIKTDCKVRKDGSTVKAEYKGNINKKDPDDVIKSFLEKFGL